MSRRGTDWATGATMPNDRFPAFETPLTPSLPYDNPIDEPDAASEALVERLAEAMYTTAIMSPAWADQDEIIRDEWRRYARAVLPIIAEVVAERDALREQVAELRERLRKIQPGSQWTDAEMDEWAEQERTGTDEGHQCCPDCDDDPEDHTLHADGCKRVESGDTRLSCTNPNGSWNPWPALAGPTASEERSDG